MDARIAPKPLSGTIRAIASKSIAHRMLICAALADGTTCIDCPTSSVDIEATASCLASLGCNVVHPEGAFIVTPPTEGFSRDAVLDCHESGSTLRFMLPVVSALGCGASFIGEGRLASRPLSPLYEELLAHGMSLSEQGTFPLTVEGELAPGRFELPGNVSSQFISGLLMAAPALGGGLEVLVREPIESRPYIDLTISALAGFGVHVERTALDGAMLFRVAEGSACTSEGIVRVEGDWSNAAFWLCAGALGTEPIEVLGLDPESPQGDRAVIDALREFGADVACTGNSVTVTPGSLHAVDIDAHDFPDLVPPLAMVAAAAKGTTRITGAERLRLKESDRLESVSSVLRAFGVEVSVEPDGLTITGRERFSPCTCDAAGDHRICMQAAIGAIRADGPVTITGAQAVSKSYPAFFEDYATLGGSVEIEGS